VKIIVLKVVRLPFCALGDNTSHKTLTSGLMI
jgi:hypothetical protein